MLPDQTAEPAAHGPAPAGLDICTSTAAAHHDGLAIQRRIAHQAEAPQQPILGTSSLGFLHHRQGSKATTPANLGWAISSPNRQFSLFVAWYDRGLAQPGLLPRTIE